jgi:hypothetical protein
VPQTTAIDSGTGTATRTATWEDLESRITITRAHPTDYGLRQVLARLDDGPRIALLFGESWAQEVTPGRHVMRVHNTLFWKRLEFSIEPGEHLEFIVINSARWWTAGVAGVLGSAPLFLSVECRSLR